MNNGGRLVSVAIFGLALAACATAAPVQSTKPLTALTANVKATPNGDAVVMRVGQTVGIELPRPSRFQVDYDGDAMQLVIPVDPAKLRAPGPDGWVWKALKPGETTITLTSIADCPNPPCAPNVMRLTVNLVVR